MYLLCLKIEFYIIYKEFKWKEEEILLYKYENIVEFLEIKINIEFKIRII